jgi:hypothetical protein
MVREALALQRHLRGGVQPLTVGYDGAYLTVCSEFELAIRDLIDRYVERAAVCASGARTPGASRRAAARGRELAKQFRARSAERTESIVRHAKGIFDRLGFRHELGFDRTRNYEAPLFGSRERQHKLAI